VHPSTRKITAARSETVREALTKKEEENEESRKDSGRLRHLVQGP